MTIKTPFKFENTFGDEVFEQFLIPYANWLFGESGEPFKAQYTASPWESALSQMYTKRILRLCDSRYPELLHKLGFDERELNTKTRSLINWLSNRALRASQINDRASDITSSLNGNEICWEGVTWDTATIVQCMIDALKDSSLELNSTEVNLLNKDIFDAIRWLCSSITNWKSSGVYSFGYTDLARVGICLIDLIESESFLTQNNRGYRGGSSTVFLLAGESVNYILQHLLNSAIYPETSRDKEDFSFDNCHFVWWGDYFSTAEVMEFIARFHSFAINKECQEATSKYIPIEKVEETSLRIRTLLVGAAHYLESLQTEGLWGGHIDTIKALTGYIKTTSMLSEQVEDPYFRLSYEAKPHVVFSSVRWLCDYKQTFLYEDQQKIAKSFMHTMFLTVFCADALLVAYEEWSEIEENTANLYEIVIWSTQNHFSEDRSKLAKATLDYERFNNITKKEYKEATDKIESLERFQKKVEMFTISSCGLFIASAIFILWQKNLGYLKFPVDFNVIPSVSTSLLLGAAITLIFHRAISIFSRR